LPPRPEKKKGRGIFYLKLDEGRREGENGYASGGGKMIRKIVAYAIILTLLWGTSYQFLGQEGQSATVKIKKAIPADARVYVRLLEQVSGKRGDAQPGQQVRCEIWRDLVVDGDILIKAGTHVLVKVDEVKHAKMAGVKGKVSLAAFETTAVDGQPVLLDGGYMKEGKSRVALSVTLCIVVFIPLIFIMGKSAVLPEGMVFDAFTTSRQEVLLEKDRAEAAAPVINLASSLSKIKAEVVLDNLQKDPKAEVFQIRIDIAEGNPKELVIDNVNGNPIEPISLNIISSTPHDGGATIYTDVKIKKLSEHFQKGINRFDVAYKDNGVRVATEVVLNIQI
jgi:hypothetical protein